MVHGPSDLALLENTLGMLDVFRELEPTMPVQYAMTFLLICQNADISLQEVSQRLGLSQSATSRGISVFTEWSWLKKPGHKLISYTADPMDMRRKRISLTRKGVNFRESLLDSIRQIGR